MRVASSTPPSRQQSPHALIAYKQGLLGTEDFFTSEHRLPDSGDSAEKRGQIEAHPATLVELNTTMLVDPIAWALTSHRATEAQTKCSPCGAALKQRALTYCSIAPPYPMAAWHHRISPRWMKWRGAGLRITERSLLSPAPQPYSHSIVPGGLLVMS